MTEMGCDKFVSELRQVGGLPQVLRFIHDITEVLLKVVLNTTTPQIDWMFLDIARGFF